LSETVAWLRTPAAIRARCFLLLALAERDGLEHFALATDRLPACADYVAETIRANYPDLAVPYHSRWRHFAAGGVDRWGELAEGLEGVGPQEVARIRFDLAVTSVLLDAGAGPDWRYRAEDGRVCVRSEGLAVASFEAFAAGAFSADADASLRADAAALAAFDAGTLAGLFQVGPDNPLVGLDGRAGLLRRLSQRVAGAPEWFGKPGRIGHLFDALVARAGRGPLPAANVLSAVLDSLGPVWPGRVVADGVNLGDVGRHQLAVDDHPVPGLVPFHKLSQWLTYSLLEPLEDAGIEVTGLDALTGLPEYRNGGLLLDTGVLVPKHAAVVDQAHAPDSEIVVEWRALTVALLDRLADQVRDRLGLDAQAFPLAKVLEGGTWAAGRQIAAELRPGGAPPIRLESDGTIF
jgi:hypothetical protein